MPYVQHFPEEFAVIRSQAMPRACIQVLSARERGNGHHYFIEDHPYSHNFHDLPLEKLEEYQLDPTIFTLRYTTNRNQQPTEVKFWALPFYVRTENHRRIPVVEFQYRSWLPTNYTAIEIFPDLNTILEIQSRIEETRLLTIREQEDNQYNQSSSLHRYNILRHFPVHGGGPDDWDDRLHVARHSLVGATSRHLFRQGRYSRSSDVTTPSPPRMPPSPRQAPEIRIVEVEVPVERIVTRVQSQPIPKHVGDILLRNARNGSDSCPIAALTFKECTKLAVSSCFHTFDKESLDRWMQTSEACPVCRSKIENVISEEM